MKPQIFLSALFMILAAGCGLGGETTAVLVVGNSHTFYNDMPEMIERIADDNGHNIDVTMIAEPGYFLAEHVAESETLAEVGSGEYDYVVLQEQSIVPAISAETNRVMAPAVSTLSSTAKGAGTEVVLYQTWGHRSGNQISGHGDYVSMQNAIIANYANLAASNGATVAGVGEAFRELHSTSTIADLYDADGYHPSQTGSYLAAIVIGETITGTDFTEGPDLVDISDDRIEELLAAN